jgi:hypothetical protein
MTTAIDGVAAASSPIDSYLGTRVGATNTFASS